MKAKTNTTQNPVNQPKETTHKTAVPHGIDDFEENSKKKMLINILSIIMMIGIPAVAVYDGFTVTSLILPKAPALLFALGTKSMGLLANYKLESGEYVTSKQREIAKNVYWLSVGMAGFAIALVAVKTILPHWAILLATAIITSSTFLSMGLIHKADSLNPKNMAILLKKEGEHKAKMLHIKKQDELTTQQLQTKYNNAIEGAKQEYLKAVTKNNIMTNELTIQQAESEIALKRSERMVNDAKSLIEKQGNEGLKVKGQALDDMFKQIAAYSKTSEGQAQMAELSKLFFGATIDDVKAQLLPPSVRQELPANVPAPVSPPKV